MYVLTCTLFSDLLTVLALHRVIEKVGTVIARHCYKLERARHVQRGRVQVPAARQPLTTSSFGLDAF